MQVSACGDCDQVINSDLCSKVHKVMFEVLTIVFLKIQAFWDVTLYHWIHSSQCFEGL